ncbi:hypothetical protein BJV74DRAFT_771504 [Russula compacta]|nr:hypothetical protein BJV74DRAFT_771504 [Russula compacta]
MKGTGSEIAYLLFPDTFYTAPLETWAAAIQRRPSEAKQCLINQVVHYKGIKDMEHEFLVLYACHPSGSKIVLGVDRNAEAFITTASSQQASSCVLESGSSSYLAYDGIQVSHDGTPTPILAQHGPCVPLSTVTFTSTSTSIASDPNATSNTNHTNLPRRPSLLHLSVLLLTIRTHFPSYALLQYQCYFFARATCLALIDLFGGAETVLDEGRRAATWRGVHVSLYSAGRAALQNMLLLPLVEFPALIVPAGLFAVYSAVKLYDGNIVESETDRRRISDEKIREHVIPQKYRAAWRSFVLKGKEAIKQN